MPPGSALFTLGVAALAGMSATVLAARLRVPAIVVLLATGACLGREGLGLVRPDALGAGLPVLVECAVAVILFEGALSLRVRQFREHSRPIRNLLTIGAAITFAGATLLARLVLGFRWREAAVTGAILIVTGPTVVTPLLRFIRPSRRLAEILRWEGILIDPIGALVGVVVLEAAVSREGATLFAAASSYASTMFAGGAVGAGAALALDFALRRPGLVEDDLRSPLALAVALAAFAGAEWIAADSGLFAATIAGLVIAAREPPGAGEIERFKGTLSSFILAIIFVLLSAIVDLRAVAGLGWRGPLFLAGLVLVRAACVGVSTIASGLSLRERAFLAWLSPRGVVAAAVASAFADVLIEHGQPGGEAVRAAVFFVIVGTVVVQGATARPLARRLGVLAPERNEVLIVGAERFGRALATELGAAGVPVTLVDKNPAKLALLDGPGVRALAADAHDADETATIDRDALAVVLAATPNDEVNALVCGAFAPDLGKDRVSQVPSSRRALERGARHAATRWSFAFGERLTLEDLDAALAGGGRLRTVEPVAAEPAEALRARLGTPFRPLVEVAAGGAVALVRGRNALLRPGTRVIGVEAPPDRGERPALDESDEAEPAAARPA